MNTPVDQGFQLIPEVALLSLGCQSETTQRKNMVLRTRLHDPSTPNETSDISDMEAPAEVFVFGDQTVSFEPTLHSLLHVKDNAVITDFFDRVGFQLRRHIGSLPLHQQEWFPFFTTLIDLFAQHENCAAAPALKFPLLCATQLGQFIK